MRGLSGGNGQYNCGGVSSGTGTQDDDRKNRIRAMYLYRRITYYYTITAIDE